MKIPLLLPVLIINLILLLLAPLGVLERYASNKRQVNIYVISLARSNDRKHKYHKILVDNGVEFKYHIGIDGINMQVSDLILKRKYIKNTTTLNKGQIGCFLSHISLLELLAGKPGDNFTILEDDVTIEDFKMFKKAPPLITNYDIVFLGHCYEEQGRVVKEVKGYDIRQSVVPQCTHAYTISKKGISKILEYMKDKKFNEPIDVVYKNMIKDAVLTNCYSYFPQVVSQSWQNNDVSTESFVPQAN